MKFVFTAFFVAISLFSPFFTLGQSHTLIELTTKQWIGSYWFPGIFSPDSRYFLSFASHPSRDYWTNLEIWILDSFQIWSVDTGQVVNDIPISHPIGDLPTGPPYFDACFSPSGRYVVVPTWGNIYLWDRETSHLSHFSFFYFDDGFDTLPYCFCFNNEETFLAAYYPELGILIYPLDEDRKEHALLPRVSDNWTDIMLLDLAFSTDGRLFASFDKKGIVNIWDLSVLIPSPEILNSRDPLQASDSSVLNLHGNIRSFSGQNLVIEVIDGHEEDISGHSVRDGQSWRGNITWDLVAKKGQYTPEVLSLRKAEKFEALQATILGEIGPEFEFHLISPDYDKTIAVKETEIYEGEYASIYRSVVDQAYLLIMEPATNNLSPTPTLALEPTSTSTATPAPSPIPSSNPQIPSEHHFPWIDFSWLPGGLDETLPRADIFLRDEDFAYGYIMEVSAAAGEVATFIRTTPAVTAKPPLLSVSARVLSGQGSIYLAVIDSAATGTLTLTTRNDISSFVDWNEIKVSPDFTPEGDGYLFLVQVVGHPATSEPFSVHLKNIRYFEN